jgi:hypothetical protein
LSSVRIVPSVSSKSKARSRPADEPAVTCAHAAARGGLLLKGGTLLTDAPLRLASTFQIQNGGGGAVVCKREAPLSIITADVSVPPPPPHKRSCTSFTHAAAAALLYAKDRNIFVSCSANTNVSTVCGPSLTRIRPPPRPPQPHLTKNGIQPL